MNPNSCTGNKQLLILYWLLHLLVEEYWNSLGVRFRKKCGISSENLWNSFWANRNCRKFFNSKHIHNIKCISWGEPMSDQCF